MKAHKPTADTRSQVRAMAAFGIRQDDMAKYLGIAPKTLRLHYRDDLDRGMVEANMKVAESLFRQATEDNNTAAQIFWLKARAGWTEKQVIQHEDGAAAEVDLSKLTADELRAWKELLAKASTADD